MSSCVVFKKLNDILLCHKQFDEVWSNFVHSYAYCGVLLCCGLLKVKASLCSHSGPPLPPQPHQWAYLLYVNTYQLRIYLSWLIQFQTQHVLFMARTGVERGLNINTGLWNKQELLTRKFSVAYCNANSQTKVKHKISEIAKKLMFTNTAGPTDVLLYSCSIL